MRFLTGQQVAALGGLDPHAALSDVTDATLLMAAGDAVMPAETHVPLDTAPGKVYALPARVGGRFNATGVKWTAHRPQPQDALPMALTVTLINRADTGVPVGLGGERRSDGGAHRRGVGARPAPRRAARGEARPAARRGRTGARASGDATRALSGALVFRVVEPHARAAGKYARRGVAVPV